jgi:hypothetical protein
MREILFTEDLLEGVCELEDTSVGDRVGDELPVFLGVEDALVPHFSEKLRELRLSDRTVLLEISYCFRSIAELTEDEKSFRMSQELQDVRDFSRFFLEIVHILEKCNIHEHIIKI